MRITATFSVEAPDLETLKAKAAEHLRTLSPTMVVSTMTITPALAMDGFKGRWRAAVVATPR